MHTEIGGSATRAASANRRPDFLCVDAQKSRCLSRGDYCAQWETASHASRFAQPWSRCGTGPERVSQGEPDGGCDCRATSREERLMIIYPRDYSSATIQEILEAVDSDILFIGDPRVGIEPGPRMFDRVAQVIRDSGAGWVYGDAVGHSRIDYQQGSIRDNFDFGSVAGVSV